MRYPLDPSQGRFTVQAFAKGALSALGHNPTFAVREFSGELRCTPETIVPASFHLVIRADSLALTDPVSAKDRESIETSTRKDVLETATHPEIVFRSTAITADKVADNWFRLRLAGDLDLHGVKTPHQIDAQLRLSNDRMSLSGDTTLRLSAHRIKPVSALAGMITLKDELKLTFDLIGRPQAE